MNATPVFWFTGLSGAGKTTICMAVRQHLEERGCKVLILDGDDVRARLNCHLGFSEADIKENNALIASLCADMRCDCDVVLVPIISPYRLSRQAARDLLSPEFYEVYIKANLDVVAARDVKGLYAKAQNGEIDNMIGYSPNAPYEPPEAADLVIDTGRGEPKAAIQTMFDFICKRLEPAGAGGQ